MKQYEDFFYTVINDLKHYDWILKWYKDHTSEGYCWVDSKIINIGPAAKNIKRLILHEIAHIDTCINDNCKHRIEFWLKYEELLEKYLPGEEISDSEKYCKKLYT